LRPSCDLLSGSLIRSPTQSRAAAINELVGEDLSISETGYETALWLLYAVLDSILHEGQVVGDADRAMIEKGEQDQRRITSSFMASDVYDFSIVL
jgi:hypothetical protein